MKIDFDRKKRELTLRNRRLDFADADKVFSGVVVEYEDDRFDYGETRITTVGMLRGVVVVIVSTDYNDDVRRIISMRRATKGEQDEYYERVG